MRRIAGRRPVAAHRAPGYEHRRLASTVDGTKKLLVWTENYGLGGCDRFLVDLLSGLGGRLVSVALAGNPHPAFDRWLSARLPWALPRAEVSVANLVDTPLRRLDRWRGTARGTEAAPMLPLDARADALPWRLAIAAARYTQASTNWLRLVRLLTQAGPDVLLINNGGYPGGQSCRMAALAARRAGVKLVVHFVHNMAQPPAWPSEVERRLDHRVNLATDLWVTAAERASDELSRKRGVPRERIVTIHYGIDLPSPHLSEPDWTLRTELAFSDSRPSLVVVANLVPRKGLSVLLRALAGLRDGGLDFATALVGDGPMRGQLAAEVRNLQLSGSVRLLGWRDDVDAILAQSDILALPSLAYECLPYVILEAMGHELPVVSTDVAGIPEMVVDGQTGLVVSPGDADGLARALAQLAQDPARARAMGECGRKRLTQQFSRRAMVDAMSRALGLD
jgi:glycosyltransferase involved in cell wall biosynthesis